MQQLPAAGWLKGLSEEALHHIEIKGVFRHYPSKETVFLQKSELTHYYIVVSGLANAYRQNEDGKRWTAGLFSKGDLFPHVGLLDDKHEYPANSETLSECTLLVIPRNEMRMIFASNPQIRLYLTLFLTEKSQDLIARFSDSVLGTAADRVLSFLKKLACNSGIRESDGRYLIDLGLTEQNIAEYIGVTPETVSRVLNRLCEEGKVEKLARKKLLVRLQT
ncbi:MULTISPECIES: Crp/Fnr family transcriptional regulator [unclassified Sporolactobacillus]|uniref:Crp/Fnr family transcriptional regulator n=1 Tax=unclassified Sporolactobacillus TaxID=2628533 RepID=UPI002368E3C5|nr:Crp/Fnr family transcriptional regulator [Sporolactobacillus sp. CQH2019]MDD9147529.1 Crp/Fnr family transcriptional regulator [Sporolactobacillus sp. CQH2019]